jgi:hypothetical protein
MMVARWNFLFGMGFTLLTIAAGWHAYNTVIHDAPSHLAMIRHRNWVMTTFALLLCIAGWKYYLSCRGKSKSWLFTGLLAIAAVFLLSTAWHGGELVFRYGLGVISMPKSVGPGHSHEHDDVPAQGEGTPQADGPLPMMTPRTADMRMTRNTATKLPLRMTRARLPKKEGYDPALCTPPHRD